MAHSPIDDQDTQPKDLMSLEGEVLGGYRLESQLGAGGMAWVYQATHGRLGGKAAVKILFPQWSQKPEMRQRFLQEAQIQYQLNHPHIVRVLDLIEEQGVVGFVMEWCDGGDLAAHLAQRPGQALAVGEVAGLFLPLLDAVGYAHQQGVIHRDLKPQNVLLSLRGGALSPKVTDFGIAKRITEGGLTATGTIVGTMHYTSPEQLKESKHVDLRTDIYSIGAMLYQAVAGRLPFEGQMPGILLKIFEHAPPPLPASVPDDLAAVIVRCLAKTPEERYENCAALQAALASCLPTEGASSHSSALVSSLHQGGVARVSSEVHSPSKQAEGEISGYDDTAAFAVPLPSGRSEPAVTPTRRDRSRRSRVGLWLLLGLLLAFGGLAGLWWIGGPEPVSHLADAGAHTTKRHPSQRRGLLPDQATLSVPRPPDQPLSRRGIAPRPSPPERTRPRPARRRPQPRPRPRGCAAGDAMACFREGAAAMSKGTPAGYRRARALLTKACQKKVAAGCRELALLFRMGWGTNKQPRRALRLFLKGCRLQEKDACLWAALMFQKAEGVRRQCTRANSLFKKACRLGNLAACRKRCRVRARRRPPPRPKRMYWQKRPGTAQYSKGIGRNVIDRLRYGSVSACKRVCANNRRCTFFFYNARGNLILPPHSFAYRECVFFTGKPWFGGAPRSDMYLKRYR